MMRYVVGLTMIFLTEVPETICWLAVLARTCYLAGRVPMS